MHDPHLTSGFELPRHVAHLLEAAAHWPATRWRDALRSARDPYHRSRRDVSRTICDALLAFEQRDVDDWMVRDAVRTAIQAALAAPSPAYEARELLEDAALALLARPALPLADLAVLAGPCLPLGAD
jgi:hypothetical protein